MKKEHSGPNLHLKIEKILGKILRLNTGNKPGGECLAPETVALLVEGKLSGGEKDRAQNHLSQCRQCYDIFLLTANLERERLSVEKSGKKPVLLRPLALAASLVIVVFSLFILYKTGNLPGISHRSKNEAPTGTGLPVPPQKQESRRDKAGKVATIPKELETRIPETGEGSPATEASGGKDTTATEEQAIADRDLSGKNLPGTQRELEIPRPEKTDSILRMAKTAKKSEPAEQPLRESLKMKAEIQSDEKKTEEEEAGLKPSVPQETTASPRFAGQDKEKEVVRRYADGRARTINTFSIDNDQKVVNEIIEYDPGGRIISITDPVNHTLQEFGYYPNGNQKFIRNYRKQKPHGIWIKWDIEGKVIEKTEYKEGKPLKHEPNG